MVFWGAVYHNVVPQCYVPKRVNSLLGDPHQVRYWLYYDEDLGTGIGSGISKIRGTQNRA